MSRRASRERSVTIADGDGLAVIREEQVSPFGSKADISRANSGGKLRNNSLHQHAKIPDITEKVDPKIEAMLANREAELREEFDKELKTQLNMMKERFDFVLQHEQMRSCYMLREAHRERKEKVQALQTQLECKNMTGLMYVLCSERRKSKLEKLRIIEEYTKYIHTLQDILTEGQLLILHLSRGYKTAARVDHEWREKMKSIIKEFQEYVYHFAGGTPESNQYVFDVPALLKTEAPIVDNPEEDPCNCEESDDGGESEGAATGEGGGEGGGEGAGDDDATEFEENGDEGPRKKTWWELLDSPCRPFVMFGDMEEFLPPKRRKIVAIAKAAAAKTAPRKWKEYLFNEMFVKSNCPTADVIKDVYPKRVPLDLDNKWECQGKHNEDDSVSNISFSRKYRDRAVLSSGDSTSIHRSVTVFCEKQFRWDSRRVTTNSAELRGNMGSILKIITSTNVVLPPKTNLLGARDSMEIASSTRLREKRNGCNDSNKNVSICVARTRTSSNHNLPTEFKPQKNSIMPDSIYGKESLHQDSLQVINMNKAADTDHKINYEKICPMEQCQRMQVDSFMRALPGYMRASPFMLFEQTFDGYETCSPEQLEILKQRLEHKSKVDVVQDEQSLSDFEPAVDGVAVQTSDELITGLPPCTCREPHPSIASSTTRIFRVEDLLPMKEALDEITKECFYNQHILFDRFKVVGQDTKKQPNDKVQADNKDKEEFQNMRIQEIKNILRKHPSMLDLFQSNARC